MTSAFSRNVFDDNKKIYRNIKYITVLPIGVTFKSARDQGWELPGYTIVDNWKNSGKQAVIATFDTWDRDGDLRSDFMVDIGLYLPE